MFKNKNFNIIVSSLALLSLTSCNNKKTDSSSDSSKDTSYTPYVSTRTISSDEGIINLNSNENPTLGTYDYTLGVSNYPVIENIPLKEVVENNEPLEELFTLSEVEKIAEDISNEYNNYIYENEKYLVDEYEKYIDAISNEYSNLENEYMNLLNDFSNYLNYEEELEDGTDNTDDPIYNESEKESEEETTIPIEETLDNKEFSSREEEVNSIYEKALDNASKNTDNYENVQGERSLSNRANDIISYILENISLPSYNTEDVPFIINNYNLSKDNILDYKLIRSSTFDSNYFEILALKTNNISSDDLINKINLRLDSILNSFKEHNINDVDIENSLLLLNIDDYVLFCFSNKSNDILNLFNNI